MVKLHIGYDETPRNCIAEEGNCPLAPDLGHFTKPEKAQEFADKLNELKAEGYNYNGLTGNDIHKLSNVELIYIQKDILNKAKENDNYSAYKNQIKWQKEVRTKSQNQMKDIINNDNEILQNLAENIDRVNELRDKWRNSKEEDKKSTYTDYKEALKIMNDEYKKASAITIENQKSFKKLVERKDIATDKVIQMMEKRAKHSGIKQLKANVDAEISDRDGGYSSSTKEIQPDKMPKTNISNFKLANQTRKDVQDNIDYYTNREFSNVNRDNGDSPGESTGYFTRKSIREILENEGSEDPLINKMKNILDNNDNEDVMIIPERTIDITLKDMAYRGRVGKDFYRSFENNSKTLKPLLKKFKSELGEPAFKINGEKFYMGTYDYSNDSLRERLVSLTRKEILDFIYNK